MMDPREYTIRVASPAQAAKHFDAAWEEPGFRGGMSHEEYQTFWDKQATAACPKENGVITWVLVRWDDLDGEVYSFLKTHRCACFIKSKVNGPASGEEEDIREGWYYNIRGVLTPIRHRHFGIYLPPFPADWGRPPPAIPHSLQPFIPRASGSVLWANIDISMYEKCGVGNDSATNFRVGWKSRPDQNRRMIWSLCTSTSDGSENRSNQEKRDMQAPEQKDTRGQMWEKIYDDSVPEIQRILSQRARDRLEALDSSSLDTPAFIPDPASPGTLMFIRDRGSFVPAPKWQDPTKPVPIGLRLRHPPTHDIKGDAHVGEGQEAQDAIVIFTLHNPQLSPRLLITYIHNLHPTHVASLLEALDAVVKDAGAPWTEGQVWALDPEGELMKAWRDTGREIKVDIRQGDGNKVLGVKWYEDEGEVDMIDTQMWSFV